MTLADAVTQPWTGHYLRILAAILMYGAVVHVGNMLGLTGTPWSDTPLLWRATDVVLLVFNVVVAVVLWTRAPWSAAKYQRHLREYPSMVPVLQFDSGLP